MKKTNMKTLMNLNYSTQIGRVMRTLAILPCLLFGVLFFTATNSHAQSIATSFANSGTELYAIPKGPFVTPAVADQRLEIQLVGLKEQLRSLTSGSAGYNAALWKYVYYDAIRDHIRDGKHIGEAIVMGLSVYSADAYSNVPNAVKMDNKNSAINLLKV